MKKISKEEFINKSSSIHNNKYDYSKVNFINVRTKVCIICPEHGEFWQTPAAHMNGQGCPKCQKRNYKYTTDEFINVLNTIFGNEYDYSKVKYINSQKKVCIICPEHGEFWQTPNQLLQNKCGCPKCNSTFKIFNKEDFISNALKIHKNKYDYSKVDYKNNKTKVCIICPEHGEFWQTPYNHIWAKNDCPLCAIKNRTNSQTKSLSDFILEARKVHGHKYDYSKVEYVSNKKKVCIIDIKSGNEFWQTPLNHLKGYGYNGRNKRDLSQDDYISKAKEIYGDIYDYSDTRYCGMRKDITVFCNNKDENGNYHGYFTVNARNHLNGRCCPMCSGSSYEKIVSNELHKNNINFISECGKRNLRCIGNMFLDFYLKDKKIGIECQGKQHFEYNPFFHIGKTEENFKDNDIKKYNICKDNGIELIYFIPYEYEIYNEPFYNDKKCFKNIEDLIKYLLLFN